MDSSLLPVIVAHRGYAARYPENTIEAVQGAADVGARWVEVDVQLREGIPVLSHDFEMTGDEPTLAEFAAWLQANPQVSALVELKTESLHVYGRRTVVDAVLAVLAGNWYPISFDFEALQLLAIAGAPAPGWVVCGFSAEVSEKARAISARWLIINKIFLEGPPPKGPWQWMVYEVATGAEARAMRQRGIRWLETMDYERIRRGLES
jgi:glycerophosphoryl diester phosphodiesterase